MWNKLYNAAVKVQNGRTIIEILLDLENKETVKLKELIPNWWGYDRFEE